LRPAVSLNREIGIKWAPGGAQRATLAFFRVDVEDELVVASNIGGRTTFRNASRTRREGFELGWQGRFASGWEAAVAYTLLNARFTSSFTSVGGLPATPVFVPAGNRLPGVPRSTLYGELVWRHAASGFHAGVEARRNSKIFVDDRNSDAAEAYTVANLRAGFEQRAGRWRFTEYVRLDNVTDREYVGSVIVAEGNRRFFEPAPGRNWLAGVAAELAF
jgi:iron complex outermembrane receptor protein